MISQRTDVLTPWIAAWALVGCGTCGAAESERPPLPQRPAPEIGAPAVSEASWPPELERALAPLSTWGDHQLAVHPATGEAWLATFARGDFGAFLLSRWNDGSWETKRVDLPEHVRSSFLRFAFDRASEPHFLYRGVRGEMGSDDEETLIIHARRGGGLWETEIIAAEPRDVSRPSTVGCLGLDGEGEVVFLHRRGNDGLTLVRRVDGHLESRGLETPEPLDDLLALDLSGDRVRFAWSDVSRSKVFLTTDGGPTRELHAFRAFEDRRIISAVFAADGVLHLAAEHDDGVDLLHLIVDENGILRTNFASFDAGLAEMPRVGFDGAGALITHRRIEIDGSAGELWLSRVQRHRTPLRVEVAVLEREDEGLVGSHTAPIVDGAGRIFIGSRGTSSDPGTVWVSAPREEL